ncbi:carbamoyltransferase HypF [Geoglobus acetivorans]|uniref:Carbamoyltransferase n=1 Tax=Geoglobus acetivorans TaxID=565033 RepID=A0ABZ3H658_GEOAI|nr:carbamoyltransferase HypF [Geoglobus acetivorans]
MFKILVTGRVQGVGFRPFVFRLARNMGLKGYVKNVGDGTVEIVVDRDPDVFIGRLKKEKPPMAVIDQVIIRKADGDYDDFTILKSGGVSGLFSLPPPDFAVCDECSREIFDESNRRYLYPFTTCTDCGQRFSISFSLPFDRENTTLAEFPLCEKCQEEYENPEDRRYFAQSITCPECGPHYQLAPCEIRGVEAIRKAAELLDSGKILAIKGIGGFHIACLTDDDTVKGLRVVLRRPQQPFAVMVRDIETAEKYAYVNEKEKSELLSYTRPIVVLKKKMELYQVAPHLDTVGIMLPYTALHRILFSFLRADALVMTSANMPGEPMAIEMPDIKCDAVLTHNMRIYNRVDDSVLKIVGGRRMIIRRSRGFVPTPISIEVDAEAISLGAELYNSIAVLKDRKAIPSQYIGNTANFKTFNGFFKKAVEFWLEYLSISPDFVVRDMHPLYNTSQYATELAERTGAEVLSVQHHLAHALSVMAERGLDKAMAITVDGAGYGMDGTIWGGEVLYVDLKERIFRRVARLERIKLLGGDLAVHYPLRTLFSIIYKHEKDFELLRGYEMYLREGESFELFEKMYVKNINTISASSAGRYMDAIAAMTEVCFKRTYEGEPAMKAEGLARRDDQMYEPVIEESYEPSEFSIDGSGRKDYVRIIRFAHIFSDSLKRLEQGEDRRAVAWRLIDYLAKAFCEVVKEHDIPVVVSGGVAYNSHFMASLSESLKFYTNEFVPAGDNGISLGQLYALKFLEV